jgi:DNA-binding NarL/FixJ family response regulator
MKTRVLLVDDHDVVRKGLRYVLSAEHDMEVVGEASDGLQAIAAVKELSPDVVIMDLKMAILGGAEATSQITKQSPRTRVIVLSMYSDEEFVVDALASGAKGYLLKDSVEPDLVRAVRAVAAGKTYFSPSISEALLDDYLRRRQGERSSDPYQQLTDRERQVLQLLAEGKTNKECASILNLAVSTVETHRGSLMQKLDLHNTAELVLFAVRRKLIV